MAGSGAGAAACAQEVLAALTARADSPDVCASASRAIRKLAAAPRPRQALIAAGAVAPLAAALARHPGTAREEARAALAQLGYTDAGAKWSAWGAFVAFASAAAFPWRRQVPRPAQVVPMPSGP